MLRLMLKMSHNSSVLSITSDYVGEMLKAEKYNEDGSITISGFVPDVERTSVITYVPDSEYKAQVKVDTKVSPGYEPAPPEIVNWVTFDNDTILIAPDTYAPIWVNLEVPEGTELPNKWEFIIVITLSSGRQSTGVAMAINYEIGIKVIMG